MTGKLRWGLPFLALGLAGGFFDWGPKLEKAFASLTHSQLSTGYGLVEYAPLVTYVNAIGEPLGKVSDRKSISYRYYIVRMPIENAFATGAGYQYITTGLLEMSDTADEVAGVLAHETAHNADKHVIQGIKDQFGVLTLSLALSDRLSEDQQILFGVLANLRSLRYSRKDEHKADELGTRYMTQAGFNPNYFVTSLQKLELAHPTGKMSKLEISFSSHPRTTDRIDRIKGHIQAVEENPEASRTLGMRLYERGYYEEARGFLQKAIEGNPEDSDVQVVVARIEGVLMRRESLLSAAEEPVEAGTREPEPPADIVLAVAPMEKADLGGFASAILEEEGGLTLIADRMRSDLEIALGVLEQVGPAYDRLSDAQKNSFVLAAQAEDELEALHAQDRAVLRVARKTRRMLEKTRDIPTLSRRQIAEYSQCLADATREYRQQEVPESRELSEMITAFYSHSRFRPVWGTDLMRKKMLTANRKREARQHWVDRAYECSTNALAYRVSDLLYLLYLERPEATLEYIASVGLTKGVDPDIVTETLGRGDATLRLLALNGSKVGSSGDRVSGSSDRPALWAYLNLVFGDLYRMYTGPQLSPETEIYVRTSQG